MLGVALAVEPAIGQEPPTIGVIDFYGLKTITEDQVRAVLPYAEGDSVAINFEFGDQELAMAEALGVFGVQLESVCCIGPQLGILYVGIAETPSPGLEYRPEPDGDAVLPPEIVANDTAFNDAVLAALQAGEFLTEDVSEGHSLVEHPDIRALQRKNIDYAERYRDILIEVLHGAREQRAIAATVIAYASDKSSIVPHLQRAALDPDAEVRNNAIRALTLIAYYADEYPERGIEIRPDMFVEMLNSLVWSDRNKASAVLSVLTKTRDPVLMQQLRAEALPSLIEMCRWQVDGHAYMPCVILERVVGLPEQDQLHPKETTIGMALQLIPP